MASEYNYAQYLRAITLETLSGGDKGERAYRHYLFNVSCGKFMNTLLLLTLRKAKALETFELVSPSQGRTRLWLMFVFLGGIFVLSSAGQCSRHYIRSKRCSIFSFECKRVTPFTKLPQASHFPRHPKMLCMELISVLMTLLRLFMLQ